MRTLLRFAILSAIAAPAYARVLADTVVIADAVRSIPEPGILGLIGIGVAALVATSRRKK